MERNVVQDIDCRTKERKGCFMAKNTVIEDVKTRMEEMQGSKAAQLETIQQKQAEARTQIEAADMAMRQATAEMNVDSYEEAKSRKCKAQTALDMYTGRYEQIKAQEYISEAESDKVVDSLLKYEEQLAEEFKTAAAEHLAKLAGILKEYRIAVSDTEDTLTRWQRDIHANYNTRGGSAFRDELTGQRTNRSPKPVPVRRMPYSGCGEAKRLAAFLEAEAQLKQG